MAHFLNAQGYELIIAHFTHRLRPEAEEDARFVAHLAQEWGLPYIRGEADVQAYAREKRLSLEAAARQLRYRFLFSAAEEGAAQAVAVGHTADDQIETILLHLLRGSGLKGLIGMEYRSYLQDFSPHIPLVRPLLGTWRKEIEAYCAQHGLTPRRDASNRSTQFLRNRIRLELLPLLETYNPRLREHLLQMSELLREEYQLISESVEKHWAEAFIEGKEGYIALDENILCTLPIHLRRHLIRRGIEELFRKPRDLPFHLVENAARFVDEGSLSALPLDASLAIQREGGRIYLLQPGTSLPEDWPQLPSSSPLEVPVAGKVKLGNGWELSTQPLTSFEEAWRGAEQNTNPYHAWMDISDLPQPLILRPPQPGERFAPLGMNGHTLKISDLFTNLKIPIRARSRWPLLCAGNEVIWVAGLRLSERVRLHPQSTKILYVSLYRLL
ncbi:MAG: tRNA lysidine(34) synthetase TilS [Anaerolineales bacterium]